MDMDSYEILGDMIARDLGSWQIGLDPSEKAALLKAGISAAAEGAQFGVSAYEKKQAREQAQAQANKAIATDASLAGAEATLDLARQSGDASRIAAAETVAQMASAAADTAGTGLSAEAAAKRIEAAQASAKKAAEDALTFTRDAAKQAKMRAWQKVAMRVTTGAPPGALDMAKLDTGKPSFLTRSYAGVPVWGWALGGAALLTGLVLIVRRRK